MSADELDRGGIGGHPKGLSTLFFTEMWERFSYYGMRAFLILYMMAPRQPPAASASRDASAASIYGTYTGSVWGAAIFGGLVADRLLGQYRSVLVGGHPHRARPLLARLPGAALLLHRASRLIVIGTGLLKPNASTLVGSLYEPRRRAARRRLLDLLHGHQPRRVHRAARRRLAGPEGGLAPGLRRGRRRDGGGARPVRRSARSACSPRSTGSPRGRETRRRPRVSAVLAGGFTAEEWKRMGAVIVFFLFATLFWGAYEQAGSTLTLFADRYTRLVGAGLLVPLVLVPVGPADLRDPAGAGLRLALDAARLARALEPRQVRARPVLHGALVPGAGAGGRAGPERRRRAGQPVVAGGRVLRLRAGRAVPEPGGPERRHQAGAGADRRADDGRLVPVERLRQQARGLGRRLLQHDAAADALRHGRGRDAGRGASS